MVPRRMMWHSVSRMSIFFLQLLAAEDAEVDLQRGCVIEVDVARLLGQIVMDAAARGGTSAKVVRRSGSCIIWTSWNEFGVGLRGVEVTEKPCRDPTAFSGRFLWPGPSGHRCAGGIWTRLSGLSQEGGGDGKRSAGGGMRPRLRNNRPARPAWARPSPSSVLRTQTCPGTGHPSFGCPRRRGRLRQGVGRAYLPSSTPRSAGIRTREHRRARQTLSRKPPGALKFNGRPACRRRAASPPQCAGRCRTD